MRGGSYYSVLCNYHGYLSMKINKNIVKKKNNMDMSLVFKNKWRDTSRWQQTLKVKTISLPVKLI